MGSVVHHKKFMGAVTAALAVGTAAASAQPPLPADYMLGTWTFDRTAVDGHYGALVFLPNGTYLHVENGPNENHGFPGFEVGTYTWSSPDNATVRLSFTTQLDTNGDWGAHTPGVGNEPSLDFPTYQAGGMKCLATLDVPGDACSPLNGNSGLVGGWYAGTGYGHISLLVFLPNGTYLQAIDPDAYTFETGNYSFDATTGALGVSNVHRYGGTDLTLSQMGGITASMAGGQLNLDGTQASLALGGVPAQAVPEPSAAAMLLIGALGLGAAASRRQRAGLKS